MSFYFQSINCLGINRLTIYLIYTRNECEHTCLLMSALQTPMLTQTLGVCGVHQEYGVQCRSLFAPLERN